MGLTHPAIDTRDMALYRPLRKRLKSRFIVDLPTLMRWFLGKEIGGVYENSVSCCLSMIMCFNHLMVLLAGDGGMVNGAVPILSIEVRSRRRFRRMAL